VDDEDEFLLKNYLDRVLITKDRDLFIKSKKLGREVFLVKSNDVAEQMKELKALGVKFQIVMDRCSVCNTPLRKPTEDEVLTALKEMNLGKDMLEKYELWFCENCKKLYWMGSHWVNMIRFLRKIE